MEQLRDIKSIAQIDTFNPIWILVALILLIVIALAFYILNRRPKRKRFKLSPLELAKLRIQNIDFNDPKSVAYTFSKDVAQFVDTNSSDFKALNKELEPYRYKKDVPKLDARLEKAIKEFIKGIKWRV